MTTKPFIHLFSTSVGNYIYDVNTDAILEVKDDTYKILMMQEKSDNNQIEALKRAGFLKTSHIEETIHPATNILDHFYSNCIGSIIFQVTQQCNMRCKYCIYSGEYNTRTHSDKKMSFALAKKGIEHVFAHSKDCNHLSFGFYGGEPLLEFDLIKKCVEYIESKRDSREKDFFMTTNATLFTPEIVAFLEKYKVHLTISIDGPKPINDERRKFKVANKSHYETVMKNLSYIKSKYPVYYKENVDFNAVLNQKGRFKDVIDFFNDNELFDGMYVSASMTSDEWRSSIVCSDQFAEEYYYEYFKLLLQKIGKRKQVKNSVIMENLFQAMANLRTGKHRNNPQKLPHRWHHGGPCIPGERVIFLNAEGNIFPCERVCEISEYAKIGNIAEGIDVKHAKELLNIEDSTQSQCRDCWAYRYCDICVRCIDDDEKDKQEFIFRRCEATRKAIEEEFKDYCVLRKLGMDFEVSDVRG